MDSDALFRWLSSVLAESEIDLLLYAGFMRIAPSWFVERFPGINIHPADLTLMDRGIPLYRGMQALDEAIEQKTVPIASSVHVVEADVDCGQVIAVSRDLAVTYSETVEEVHGRLKREREHVLYPTVVSLLSRGLFSQLDLPARWVDEGIVSASGRLIIGTREFTSRGVGD
jgi:phosphoribosylglycinamide formyltransferase-1